MKHPSDPAGGVKVFTIGGRMTDIRQRCLGMTDEERRWRAQWLKDQILTRDEPRDVPQYYKETTYFLRRLWKTPMHKFQKFLEPKMGQTGAYLTRHFVGKSFVTLMIVYGLTYYVKYHSNNFEYHRSLEVLAVGAQMLPDHPDYPNLPVKKPSDYYDQGFYSSVLCQENFEYHRSLEMFQAGVQMLPSHPDYPNRPVKKPSDYYDQGFYSSVLARKV